ncbi:sodium/pyruvate cotransporter BASS2, chloroplastic-like isoform X2 [Olea europaea var. sylvestris]|uniref:sodium/pyruvate cotransporter BASS2, chloroplastic-like isoform X2 n=1 Tax=Olea europaea var. sylvestris TaxID=158386 RepID=UPI000C1D5D41|nr:sodium/pyruvate cotransporter BASS2, chloroplastic-like isoform X2 [Olea europaea var. sylvestris]
MATISRFFAKDCRLQQCDALQKLNCGLSARRLHSYQNFRCELITSESDRSNLAIHSKHQSSVTAVSLPWTSASRNSRVYCKAATSGDFTDNTSKTSQYERIIETLTTLFPVWVILGTIIGIY